MAELLLSAVLQVLFDRLASRELLNFANREKVRDLFKKWETKLRNISVLLEDAEDKAMRGSDRRVQPWLDDLKDLAYDIEDVVDEFVTREGIRSTSSKEAAASGSRSIAEKCLLSSCFTGLSPRKFMFDRELRCRMEKIDGRLDFILGQKRDLGLNEGGGSMRKESYSYHRTTDSLPENFVVGRQDDKKAILAKLLNETDDHLSVIPIVGMGGVGKTTLAKSVFNDSSVAEAFPLRGWACVSDNFNMLEIARALLGSLWGDATGNDINVLHTRLGEILSEKKFLIVLDDYWNDSYIDWERLHNIYRLGMKGSKVIVTTRQVQVASMINAGPAYHHLQELSSDDCRSLLAYHALNGSTFDDHPDLKAIGEKIADKCKGLPLAAKALGGLLRSKAHKVNEWQAILNSEIWNLPQGRDGIFPSLKLSYIYLPSYLKRCFTFCAIFPQDYEFDRDTLVLLWMAEDLLDMGCQNLQRSMLDHGRQHFDELLNRSFFQRSTQDESRFVMHDLMHDLATAVGGTTCLNVGSGGFDHGRMTSPEKVRHLSYIPEYFELSTRLEKCHVFKGLRTFLALKGSGNYLSIKVVEEFLQKLKYLRTLSLSGYYAITEIPNCIGHLKHLRYLDFSWNKMKELPESICTLYNLETLILKYCFSLTELPGGINKLINLSCLDIRGTRSLEKMPLGLFHLHKLEILPKFIVGREDELRLKELQHLQNLHGKLAISNLQNVREVGDAKDAKLKAKVNLTTLDLEWDVGSGNSSSRNVDNELEVLGFLQPHPNIEKVKIYGYGGTSFPAWIGSPSLVNIKHIRLDGCQNIRTLPPLGLLPSLKELKIIGLNGICTVGPEFFGNVARPFPSLEVLTFTSMQAWEAWSFSSGDKQIEDAFPQLSELKLQQCPKLIVGWLCRLHSLVQLEIKDCPLLKASSSMADLSLLENLKLESCNHEVVLAGISSIIPNSLTEISLTSIQGLEHLNADVLRSLSALENLKITQCDGLRCLWEDDVEAVESLARLKFLRIQRCANLERLPNNMQRLTSLRELSIDSCSKFEYVSEGMMSCSCLEKLSLERCGSLVCFPESATLPTTLRSLKIRDCEKLERLPGGIFNNGDSCSSKHAIQLQLEDLVIDGCPSLKPLVGSNKKQGMHLAPSSLKILRILESGAALDCLLEEINIQDCNINSITHRLHMFTSLSELQLAGSSSLEVEVFPQLPSSLKTFSLNGCDKMKSLPHRMHTSTSLKVLWLGGLSIESFPEGGLPLSLEELTVKDCKNLRQPMAEWGLHNLTALKCLVIEGVIGCLCLPGQEMTCFPPSSSQVQAASNWSLLPPNIDTLWISSQPNMVSLLNGLRGHLNSLQRLCITSCPKLRFLPKEGFPPSLGVLWIIECTRDLQRECSKGGGYFPLIERISTLSLRMDS